MSTAERQPACSSGRVGIVAGRSQGRSRRRRATAVTLSADGRTAAIVATTAAFGVVGVQMLMDGVPAMLDRTPK